MQQAQKLILDEISKMPPDKVGKVLSYIRFIGQEPEAPLDHSALTSKQFNTEIEKGFAGLESGSVVSSEVVREKMQRQYGL